MVVGDYYEKELSKSKEHGSMLGRQVCHSGFERLN
jgi:hypothetical protein